MPLHVQSQVITPTETAVAMRTLERFLAGVFPIVTRQLVTARKPPRATLPRALVRLLPSVRPLVRLQVRTLRVNLRAPNVVTLVYALSRIVHRSPPHPQTIVRLCRGEVSEWVRVDHAKSGIVQLRVGDVSTSDQHGENVGGLEVLVTATTSTLQVALRSAVQTRLVAG